MKRRSTQPKKRRDRKTGQSPYAKYGKIEYKYEPAALDRAQAECVRFNAKARPHN